MNTKKEEVIESLAEIIREIHERVYGDSTFDPLMDDLKLTYWKFVTGDPRLTKDDLLARLIPMKGPKGIIFH